ncbi:MAG: LytTR family transcriptional regulator [Bacteroidales bacterium]|nr:LytTR family transcriptional regulator [Bacteroidales bacterium]
MLPWEKKIPYYLTERKNTVSFILFTALFALVFINIYSPFGVDKRLDVSELHFFLYSSIVILIGMLVIVISRTLMYLFTRYRPMKYIVYAGWIIGEILVLALVYCLIQWFFLQSGDNFMLVFRKTVRTTAYIILLPYIISWLYLSFKDKYTTLEKIESKDTTQGITGNSQKKARMASSMFSFHDEKGSLKFSIKKDDLLYIEAADNYIVLHYLANQKPARYMIRNTLKRIEQDMPESGLVRCHRSYMVNIDNVKVIRKEKEGLIIGFESSSGMTVPISKTYFDIFIKRLSHFAGVEKEDV